MGGIFTDLRRIVSLMKVSLRRARLWGLSVLAITIVGHGNLAADLTGQVPSSYGMSRLNRDLSRKIQGDEAMVTEEREFQHG
jgi:hypothetical protein